MNWLFKIAAFRALSALPGGTRLYRLAQERITGSLVPTRDRVNLKVTVGLRYWAWLEANATPPIGGAHLDFGTGWHPTIPLLYHALGVERQWLFDLNPLLDAKLVAETRATVVKIVEDPAWPARARLRRAVPAVSPDGASWREALRAAGMQYVAPYAGAWPTVAGAVDLATSTQVLLHIPRAALAEIFSSIFAALRPGGHFLATIHLRDLHATPANGLPPHHHLRYGPWVWEHLINTPLMPYNRLKAPDYRALLEGAGFIVRGWEVDPATPAELAAFDRTPVHRSFAHYTREDLSATHLFFAAQKPPAS